MKIILFLVLLFSGSCYSQTADFIVLKNKNKTVKTYYAGTDIGFTALNGAYISAHINGIKNDTLFLQEYVLRYLPTTIGTYILDTVGSYRYKFHYNQIKIMGRQQKKGFNTKGSGASLFAGGILLTLASGVVYLVDRDKFSAPLLIASTTLAVAGYFMAKSGGGGFVIGKKYKLIYMDMGNNKM